LKGLLLMQCTSPYWRYPLCPHQPYRNEEIYHQQEWAPPHHQHVKTYLDDNLPGQWIHQRGSAEYPLHSSDLTSLHFYLWCYLMVSAYSTQPATLQERRHETEQSRTAISADTLVNICDLAAHCCQQGQEVNDVHSVHTQ
jgi:hypothetical protein